MIRRHIIDQALHCLLTGFSIKNRKKRQNKPDTPKMTNGLVQHIKVEDSTTSIQLVRVRCCCRLCWFLISSFPATFFPALFESRFHLYGVSLSIAKSLLDRLVPGQVPFLSKQLYYGFFFSFSQFEIYNFNEVLLKIKGIPCLLSIPLFFYFIK